MMVALNPEEISPMRQKTKGQPSSILSLYTMFSLVLMLLSATGSLAQDSGTSEPTRQEKFISIPNFWDPNHKYERPDLDVESIKFLASDDFPPFSFRNSQGNLIGFNIDLARAICRELDLSCSLHIKEFDQLEEALTQDEGDAIIAGISITEESQKRLLFSDVYLRIPGRFVVSTSSNLYPIPESLEGQAISVVSGTVHESFLRQHFPNSEIAAFDEAGDARDALRNRLVAAHFADGLSLGFWLYSQNAAGCCKFAEGAWDNQEHFGPGLAIAVDPSRPKLASTFNYALARIFASGVYRELYFKYFPAGLY